jgi:hypothetical protein
VWMMETVLIALSARADRGRARAEPPSSRRMSRRFGWWGGSGIGIGIGLPEARAE